MLLTLLYTIFQIVDRDCEELQIPTRERFKGEEKFKILGFSNRIYLNGLDLCIISEIV